MKYERAIGIKKNIWEDNIDLSFTSNYILSVKENVFYLSNK